MGTLYITCGLPFAGKTTLARALAGRLGCPRVSVDAINRERSLPDGGAGLPEEVWAESHRIALGRVDELLRAGGDAVVDDTCCYRRLRDDYREVAARRGARAVVVLLDPPRGEVEARRRRNLATGDRNPVTDAVFEHLVRTFEWPAPDEAATVYCGGDDLSAWVDRLAGSGPAGSPEA